MRKVINFAVYKHIVDKVANSLYITIYNCRLMKDKPQCYIYKLKSK